MSHIELLKEHNLKATPQRLCILSVLDNYGHASLDEIQDHTKKNFPTLSVSTIYRNINEMVDKGLISEVKVKNMKDRFELDKHQHAHLVCIKCGSIEDIIIDTGAFEKMLKDKIDHEILNTTVSFDSVCKKCQKN